MASPQVKRSALTKKILKTKRSGTTTLWWADQVKFEFGGHFGGQKPKNVKSQKGINRFWPLLAKLLFTTGSNLAQDLFTLTRIYNFVFKKIFVGGRLDNNRKTNTREKEEEEEKEEKNVRSSSKLARLRRR